MDTKSKMGPKLRADRKKDASSKGARDGWGYVRPQNFAACTYTTVFSEMAYCAIGAQPRVNFRFGIWKGVQPVYVDREPLGTLVDNSEYRGA